MIYLVKGVELFGSILASNIQKNFLATRMVSQKSRHIVNLSSNETSIGMTSILQVTAARKTNLVLDDNPAIGFLVVLCNILHSVHLTHRVPSPECALTQTTRPYHVH